MPYQRNFPPLPRILRLALIPVAAILLALAPAAPTPAAPSGPVGTEVSFHSQGQTLHGTVLAPPGDPRRRPGLVLVAGAGSTGRDDYRPEAETFARAGIVTLIYDKRASYSRAVTSFRDLAADALAGVALLRGRADVAPSRVGLWGHSQGGWVVPLAADMSPRVGFVITVGASALRADRTQLWSNHTYLTHAGVAPELIEPIGVNLSRTLIGAGLFGDTGNDPVANLEKLRQPLLGVFGDLDRSTAPAESMRLFQQALRHGGNTHYTLRVVRHADHTMRYSTDGFTRHGRTAAFAPGYTTLVTTWIDDLDAGPPAASSDPPPGQTLASQPIRSPAWYESGAFQLAVTTVLLVAFLSYPVTALGRRLRRRRDRSAACWPARLLAGTGPLVVLGTVGYLSFLVATGATGVGGTVLGRPPGWLVLQVLAVGVAAALIGTVLSQRRGRRRIGRARFCALLVGGLIFLPWAGYWGLFTV